MSWLEDYLTSNTSKRNALLTALDPSAPSATGGVQAPDPTDNAPQPTGPAGQPVAALLKAYQSYADTGHMDPLLEASRQPAGMRMGTSLAGARARLLNPGAAPSVTQHGPRAGMAPLSFQLGNGRKANVYYDENGKRQVFVY